MKKFDVNSLKSLSSTNLISDDVKQSEYFYGIMSVIDGTQENKLAIILDTEMQRIFKNIHTCSRAHIHQEISKKIYSFKALQALLLNEGVLKAIPEQDKYKHILESDEVLDTYIEFIKNLVDETIENECTIPETRQLNKEQKTIIKNILVNNIQHLSRINLFDDISQPMVPELQNKKIVIINNSYDSSYTIAYFIQQMGGNIEIVDNSKFEIEKVGQDSIVILGPGEGDINDKNDIKMQRLLLYAKKLQDLGIKTFGICLGFQAIAKNLGYSIEKQEESVIGGQIDLVINNVCEKVGVYNYFSAVLASKDILGAKIIEKEGRLYGMQTKHTSGVQFHPESFMTPNGFNILKQQLIELCKG